MAVLRWLDLLTYQIAGVLVALLGVAQRSIAWLFRLLKVAIGVYVHSRMIGMLGPPRTWLERREQALCDRLRAARKDPAR